MARAESKIAMGYLPIEPRHYAAILSLVASATLATRMLNPYVRDGERMLTSKHKRLEESPS